MTDKRIKSMIDEITNFVPKRNSESFVEVQAEHVIAAAIRLMEFCENSFDTDDVEKIEKRLFLAIRSRSPQKFKNTMRQLRERKEEK
jgi:DNA-directed RNA polymerase